MRGTGRSHAIGQCLLSQTDEDARLDHPDRYPIRAIAPYPVCDDFTLLRRLEHR